MSESDQYWALHKDENWTQVPGIRRWDRKSRTQKFFATVSQILVNLEPGTTFNPADVWQAELERDEDKLRADKEALVTKKSEKLSGADKIRASTKVASAAKKLLLEVTRIRNSKNSLLSIIRDIRIPEARAILIVEILKQAYADYKKNGDKKILYEALWAIDSIEIPNMKAPAVADKKSILVKDSSLVYDDFADVEKLLTSARKVMATEKDMIQLQLVEMYDSLPPLSKFTFGFKLDPWQKRVLRWIDAGKSVLICAPTSSGKTVLSSYVAILFKTAQAILNKQAIEDGGSVPVSKARSAPTAQSSSQSAILDDIMEGDDEGPGGEDGDFGGDDFEANDEEEEDEEDEDEEGLENLNLNEEGDDLVEEDRKRRKAFYDMRANEKDTTQRVLFVVPSEPLVWQVAAYFTKLLREEGESETKVCVVTDHFLYYPPRKFDLMPQIVVGTPLALETALTKPRGLVGKHEVNRKAQGDLLPGGFDHFDWVIYDEVHSLDGPEGAALQRLIRSMNCKFLALSATVGNADELRGWMERVKGDQIMGLEQITVNAAEVENAKPALVVPSKTAPSAAAVTKVVTICQTLTLQSTTLTVTSDTTILELKQGVYAQWPSTDPLPQVEHGRYPFQLVYKGQDLILDDATLGHYNVLSGGADEDVVIYVRLLVHLLVHQGRFINLQRYVWNDSKGSSTALQTLSPLAAVESVESLRDGVLNNSSLSFTSSDSFRVWEDIKRIYPADADSVMAMSPYNFFGKTERITLQRTKDYEDLLKTGLSVLARDFPKETQELLFCSQIHDPPKAFDLCEMILDLKGKDMLPALPFHLNSFEAIKLYQQLLAGIEYRQKRDHPTYYIQLAAEKEARKKEIDAQKKSTGKNEKDLEEAQKAGDIDTSQDFTVDEYAPHPNYIFSKGLPLSEGELTILLDEMERFDSFVPRDKQAMVDQKGKNQSILKHALIRGLRRGIGLFINQISFPSYQRAVQKLASRGKLAVVISDDSLAFGVNMPFRTCIFCGEMFGQLDELMAQQMSGRAGRRGLDTQGNLVYAGVRTRIVRRLMIGTVSNITGANHAPRYESLILQPVLSPRHVGYHRAECIGGRSLSEFISGAELAHGRYTMDHSKQSMLDLGILSYGERGALVPNPDRQMTYALLAIMWECRDNIPESISLGLMLPDIYEEFNELVKDISMNEKKSTNQEKIEFHVLSFMVIFVLLIDRTPYRGEGYEKLSDLQFFQNATRKTYYEEWEGRFEQSQASIPDQYANLRSPVVPGTELDGTFFQCVLDRNYIHTLSDELKQEMKAKMWHAGNVLRILNNNSWPEETYYRVSFFIFRKCFVKLKFLNAELIRSVINFTDVSAQDREKRVDTDKSVEKPAEAMPWSDNNNVNERSISANSFNSAVNQALHRLSHLKGTINGASNEVLKGIYAEIYKVCDAFDALKQSDRPLLQLCLDFNAKDPKLNKTLTDAIVSSTFAAGSPQRVIGVLMWFVLKIQPTVANRFPVFLKVLYDENALSEEVIREWHAADYATLLLTLPSSYSDVNEVVREAENSVSVADVGKLRTSCDIFIKWLNENDEEEDDEDDEDDEEEDA
eukprot:gene27121-33797_t